ncbi:hypothetical protein FQN60_000376 [Etheostoma spectabile]|uniref:Glucose-6-phosphate exchanger SLC37A2 n=1 Tax=Etheostoma spectabile TaxID=54343 RepID=A0A5J5D0W5_9PERO|nr:hypothetical protein FQN60_000376 [Etheostoma spectabile]
MKSSLAPGIRFTTSFSRDSWYRGFILFLTFLFYTAYHLSRKPISIVKSELHRNCSTVIRPAGFNVTDNATWCDWAPFGCSPIMAGFIYWFKPLAQSLYCMEKANSFICVVPLDRDNYKTLFGVLDNSFLVAYAIGMFFSGMFGERLPLRYYLSFGMLGSGLFTCLFGLGFFWNIHSLGYYAFIQVMNGLMQTTGWPAVVACVGNWFGKGKRGFIMGVWNSHTSVGNILGSLIAGAFVSSAWGMSFIVPGLIIASTGILCFFFLVEKPEDVNCTPPQHHSEQESSEKEPLLQNSSHVDRMGNGSITTEPADVVAVEEHPEAISFCGALSIPGVVEFSLCLLFAKLVSYTFLYWLPLYISNVAHFEAKQAGDMSTLFDVGGIVGGRATTCCVMLIAAAPMLFLYNYIGQRNIGTTVGMLLLCGGLVNGPYALITTAVSADLVRPKHRAAVGPLLAGLISPTGWNNVFYMLISADILACLFLTRLVFKEAQGWCGRTPRARGFKEI